MGEKVGPRREFIQKHALEVKDIDYHGASSSLDVNEFGNLSSPNFGEQHIIDGEWTQVATVELDASLRP